LPIADCLFPIADWIKAAEADVTVWERRAATNGYIFRNSYSIRQLYVSDLWGMGWMSGCVWRD